MFSETLRDRKLVTLEQDLAILLFTFLFPSLEANAEGISDHFRSRQTVGNRQTTVFRILSVYSRL